MRDAVMSGKFCRRTQWKPSAQLTHAGMAEAGATASGSDSPLQVAIGRSRELRSNGKRGAQPRALAGWV